MPAIVQKITPCLWFDGEAEAAANAYVAIFDNARIVRISRWLKDRFGLSWQIVPAVLPEMLMDPDPAKAGRVTKAFLQMRKFDIAALERAYAGESR